MPTSFQVATQDDLDLLLTLKAEFQAFFEETFDVEITRHAFQVLVNEPALGRVWLLMVEGRVAGYLILCFGFSIEFGGRDAFIDELFVREEYRRTGIGREALSLAEAACREYGVQTLLLELDKTNTPAQRLYESFGFAARDYLLLAKKLD